MKQKASNNSGTGPDGDVATGWRRAPHQTKQHEQEQQDKLGRA